MTTLYTNIWRRLSLIAPAALLLSLTTVTVKADENKSPTDEPEQTQTISERFEALRTQNAAKAPPAVLAVGARQRQALIDSKILETAVQIGDKMPAFALPNAKGDTVTSAELLADGPLVLVFYRGSWCPFCNLQLIGYQERIADFNKAGANIVAIGAEHPDKSLKVVNTFELGFEVLTDAQLKYANECGVAYEFTPELDSTVLSFGFDLRARNQTDKATLPLASTYVIDTDGTVKYAFLNVDYTFRAEPDEVLAVLNNL